MKIDITKTSEIEKTYRVETLGSMFDCPIDTKLSVHLQGELNLENKKWNVGLIVGPSSACRVKALTTRKSLWQARSTELETRLRD